MTTVTPAAQTALNELHRIKAPTKRAARLIEMFQELPTQADVNSLTAQLRRQAGVQDVTLLPSTTWKVRTTSPEVGAWEECGTATLVNTMDGADGVSISWPSVTFHWGVMVTFTWGGVQYVAHSADYQLTETYLSA